MKALLSNLLLASLASCAASNNTAAPSTQRTPPRAWPATHSLAMERGYELLDGAWVRTTDVHAIQSGWPRADHEYLTPAEQDRFDRGQFRCGDDWFDEGDANDYHSRLLRWWKIPRERFVAFSTCSRETTQAALRWMESTQADLLQLYGRAPELPCTVILCRSVEQYNAFATTEPAPGYIPPEAVGFSAFQHAFLCEQWLDVDAALEHPGAACAYWDAGTAAGNSWGPLAVRHAAALAFVEGLDPSLETLRAYRADPRAPFDSASFWKEKRVPRWLRYGGASYCERFFEDTGTELSDPLWARRWSLDELNALGGLGDIDEVFACELDQNEVARSRLLLLRAGALVAFVLDGENAAVAEKHAAFRAAVTAGVNPAPAIAALEHELRAQRAALRDFTGS